MTDDALPLQRKPWRPFRSRAPRVAVVRLSGILSASGNQSLNLASLAKPLNKAFRGKPDAVALQINSPGGSPVQSNLIATRILALSKEHQVPVYAFCEDVAASGGYWIAAAADEIYADAASLVGSIGVISLSFGFNDAIARLGIERRVTTAGKNKSRLDPFRPLAEEDKAWLERLQTALHEHFKAYVRERRGSKLGEASDKVMQGDVYLGAEGLELGLIDGIGDLRSVMRKRFGDKVRLSRVRGPKRFGFGLMSSRASLINSAELVETLKAEMLWSRFGV